MEKLVQKNLIYKGKIVELYNDDVLCSNGKLAKREVIYHPGGAGILIVNAKNEILLIKQYRYSYAKDLLEIPAGKLEKNEDPYKAALREMEEETGLKPLCLEDLGSIYPTCGYSSEIIYLYLAKDYQQSHTHFDEDEDITSKWYPINQVLELIDKGEIKDAKTIIAVYKYVLRMAK